MNKDSILEKCLAQLDLDFDTYLEDLKSLVRIPSCSFEGFDKENLVTSARAVQKLLNKSGLKNTEVLPFGKAHPYVYGEQLENSDAPTVILYAHHDVQPPGRSDVWKSNPYEPMVMEGPGGARLYGRGAADDKAGIIVHTAAIETILKVVGKLPVNVKVLIEGEEEIGSTHLEEFLAAHREKVQADVMVLTDTSNFDCGVPALTIALRGLVSLNVEVSSLSKTVHSGMWGGPIPDPAMGLAKAIASLVDESGNILLPEIQDQIEKISPAEKEAFSSIPFDETEFRKQAGVLPGVKLLTRTEVHPLVQTWRYPSLTVNAIQASSKAQASNIINDKAWAKVTIRTASKMDPELTAKALENKIRKSVPWGLQTTVEVVNASGPWSQMPEGPVFEAAKRALEKGYGKKAMLLGCGGSIPFVKPFSEALGGAPALLIGVEDPHTNAHGENESLLISDLKKSIASQIALFFEIGRLK